MGGTGKASGHSSGNSRSFEERARQAGGNAQAQAFARSMDELVARGGTVSPMRQQKLNKAIEGRNSYFPSQYVKEIRE